MTIKLFLIRSGQLLFSLILSALAIALMGFTVKGIYKLFMLGFNVL